MTRRPFGSIDPNSIRETELHTECRRRRERESLYSPQHDRERDAARQRAAATRTRENDEARAGRCVCNCRCCPAATVRAAVVFACEKQNSLLPGRQLRLSAVARFSDSYCIFIAFRKTCGGGAWSPTESHWTHHGNSRGMLWKNFDRIPAGP